MNFSEQEWKAAQSQMADADPEQLKAQARMMKNMDKNTVRRMNPQFATMSDAELDMMASQMEMMVELCGNQPMCRVLSHFSAMTRPSWLGRAARNRHRHAIEQASRRWRGGGRDDSARTRQKI